MSEIIDAEITPVTNKQEKEKAWTEKMSDRFNRVVAKVGPAVHKVAENLGWIIPAAGLTISGLGAISGLFSGTKKLEKCLVEDNYTGEDLLVKHPLTNSDILEMSDRMKEDGVTKAEALYDMGLLRNEKRRKI